MKKRLFSLLTTLTFSTADVIVVTASNSESPLEQAGASVKISEETLWENLARNTTEALQNESPSVRVQKTANGQGSPYLRGFTGYRTLATIDGIRYNNSVYRDGPNEYFSLIDSQAIETLELKLGAEATRYGSEAVSGAVNVVTKGVDYLGYEAGDFFTEGLIQQRFSTAEQSSITRVEYQLGRGGEWGLHLGGSSKDFGNVRAANLGELDKTGYSEYGLDLKFDWRVNRDWELTAAYQQLAQEDVWRTHSTIFSESFAGTEVGSDLRRVKDQYRDLSYLKLNAMTDFAFADELTTTLSLQRLIEDGDRIRSSGQRQIDKLKSTMFGLDIDLVKSWDQTELFYGASLYYDSVDSNRKTIATDGSITNEIQGPVGDNASYLSTGIFAELHHNWNHNLSLIAGSRLSYNQADIGRYQDPSTGNAASFSNSWSSLTSSLKLLYAISDQKIVWGGVSQAFRAPNIADLTRYGASRSGETEIAATELEPERFLTLEAGYKHEGNQLTLSTSAFYTMMDDYVASTPTGNIVAGETEVTKRNSGTGEVYGLEFSVSYQLHDQWNLSGNASWMDGNLKTPVSFTGSLEEDHLSRLSPFILSSRLTWQSADDKWTIGANVQYAAKADQLSARDAGDTQRIPPGGTPSYFLVDLVSQYRYSDDLTLSLNFNNITNEAYRSHGSGTNEPGFGAIVGIQYTF